VGAHCAVAPPDEDRIVIEDEDLQIVPDALWTATRTRLTAIKARLMESSGGKIQTRHARDVDSFDLLTGFARCACCGGSFYPVSRSHGRERAFFCGCRANQKCGPAICRNGFVMRKERIDDAVLQKVLDVLGSDVSQPAFVTAVLDCVFEAMRPDAREAAQEQQRAELAQLDRQIVRLTDAIAEGREADVPAQLIAAEAGASR
jgi:hypothetical protein